MIIITFNGHSNIGKTTSIQMAAARFFTLKQQQKITVQTSVNDPSRQSVNLTCGIKIAFCSDGDDKTTAEENYKFAQNNRCDILITSSRTRGETYDYWHERITTPCNEGVLLKAIDFWTEHNTNLLDGHNEYHRVNNMNAGAILCALDDAIIYCCPTYRKYATMA